MKTKSIATPATATVAKSSKVSKTAKAEVSTPSTEKVTKEKKVKVLSKEVTPSNKASLVEAVIAKREVKYIYPAEVVDTLTRKSWRQKTRNKLESLEKALLKITDKESKEYRKAKKAFESFKAEVVKPEA